MPQYTLDQLLAGLNDGGSGVTSDLQYLPPDYDGPDINGNHVLTLEEAVANLTREGAQWNVGPDGRIYFSFYNGTTTGLYNNPNESFLYGYTAGFSAMTAEQRDAVRDSIALWDDLVAVEFVETNGLGADIIFMNTSTGPGQAAAILPQYGPGRYGRIEGDVFVNHEQPDNFDLYYGGYGQTAITHEIGHALGLSHTGDYNATDEEGNPAFPTYEDDAEFFQDSMQYSIMSYFHHGNTGARGFVNWATGGFAHTPQTPMVHDIAAAQSLYGVDTTTRTGDTVYGFNSTADRDVFDFEVNTNPFLTIYDAGGHDTLDLSGFTGGSAVLDLREGAYSTGYNYGNAAEINVALGFPANALSQTFWNAVYDGRTANPAFLTENIGIAYGTVIEDGVTGRGNDVLIGNGGANRLDGGAGNDVFTGNGGGDTFVFNHSGGSDRITDFTRGSDMIDLRGIDAVAGGADSAFDFIGGGAFTSTAGELRTFVSNGSNFLAGDVNGDGTADFLINLGSVQVDQTDILL